MDDWRRILKEFQEDMELTDEQLAEKCMHGDSVIEKEMAMSVYEGRVESDLAQLRKDAASDLEEVWPSSTGLGMRPLSSPVTRKRFVAWERRPDLSAHHQKCQRILMEQ